jgi:hypothetical protein
VTVEHFTGSRLTRINWAAMVVADDGTKTYCSHSHGHQTKEAARTCGRKMVKS